MSQPSRLVDALLTLAAVGSLVPFLLGMRNANLGPFAVAAIWLARCVLTPACRERSAAWLRGLWASADDYPARTSALPLGAALAFVAVPSAMLFTLSDLGQGGDTRPVMLTAVRLVTAGTLEIGAASRR
jgi:hypothetical protein